MQLINNEFTGKMPVPQDFTKNIAIVRTSCLLPSNACYLLLVTCYLLLIQQTLTT
ncbi:MAG: hypothetical protein F6K41_16870 [Symploca sp. SIO3E6]|nr:hypothetical protein [Caldora sp. SIO3E6]